MSLRQTMLRRFNGWWFFAAVYLVLLVVSAANALWSSGQPLTILGNLLLVCLASAFMGVLSASVWNSIRPEEMGGTTKRGLTIGCVVIAVILASLLVWNVADVFLGLRGMMWERRKGAWWSDQEARARLMAALHMDVLASREGPADPSGIADDVEEALAAKGVSVPVRYAVAVIDGGVWVAEMPPLALYHHCVMYSDGRVMYSGDERLVAAIWHKALRESTVVEVPSPMVKTAPLATGEPNLLPEVRAGALRSP